METTEKQHPRGAPDAALSHLARVTTLRLEARWLESDGSYGAGEGTGEAVCRWESRAAVVVEEQGTWSPRPGVTLPFRRSYRCRAEGSSIALESLSSGEDRPPLPLAHDGSDTWASPAPHRCGADLYQAQVTLDPERVAIRWDARGPTKLYTLRVTYDLGDDSAEAYGRTALSFAAATASRHLHPPDISP